MHHGFWRRTLATWARSRATSAWLSAALVSIWTRSGRSAHALVQGRQLQDPVEAHRQRDLDLAAGRVAVRDPGDRRLGDDLVDVGVGRLDAAALLDDPDRDGLLVVADGAERAAHGDRQPVVAVHEEDGLEVGQADGQHPEPAGADVQHLDLDRPAHLLGGHAERRREPGAGRVEIGGRGRARPARRRAAGRASPGRPPPAARSPSSRRRWPRPWRPPGPGRRAAWARPAPRTGGPPRRACGCCRRPAGPGRSSARRARSAASIACRVSSMVRSSRLRVSVSNSSRVTVTSTSWPSCATVTVVCGRRVRLRFAFSAARINACEPALSSSGSSASGCALVNACDRCTASFSSQSAPPSSWSPSIDTTARRRSASSTTVTSNVPPPRS